MRDKSRSVAFYTALCVFALAFIAPIGYIIAQFIIAAVGDPSVVKSSILDRRQLVLLTRSLSIATGAAGIGLAIGFVCAFILAAKDLPYRKLLFFLVLVPLLIPPYVMAGAWIHLLSPAGVVNKILTSLSLSPISIHNLAGCIWCLGISFFPIVAIVLATGLSELDGNLVDMARLNGGRWIVFRYGVLPQVWPHLIASICLVVIFVIAQYGVPSLLGVNTYPVEIFAQFSAFYDDIAAFGTAIPLILLVVFLIILQWRLMRNCDYVRINPASEADNRIKLRRLKSVAICFLLLVFVITVLVPFISVFANAQGLSKVISTLRRFGDGVLTTSLLALLAACISTIIAYPIGKFLAESKSWFARMLDVLCWLAIAIPGTITALGLAKFTGIVPFIRRMDSFGFVLLLCYVGMFSAFAVRIFYTAFKRSDSNIEEAALLDCPHGYQKLIYVDIPIHSGAIAASAIVVFVLVLGELNATVLLIPPGKATLSVSIDNLLHYGANAQASILCLTEALLTIIVVGIAMLIFNYRNRMTK